MTQFQFALFLWAVILVSTAQLIFITWRCWPLLCGLRVLWRPIRSKVYCVWCWQALHIKQWYPARWSSCMCMHHFHVEQKRLAVRRAARLAACPPAAAFPVVVGEAEQRPMHEQAEVLA